MEQHSAIHRVPDSCDFRLSSSGNCLHSQFQNRGLVVQFSLRIASLVTFIFATTTAFAATVYSQASPAEPTGAFSSVDIPAIGQKIADNFMLSNDGPTTVRSLRFIGGYGSRNPPPLDPSLESLPDDNFRIAFLQDFAGAPGLPVIGGDFASVTSVNRTPTGGELLNGIITPLEHAVNLGDGVILDGNTEYWISITQNPDPEFGWSWARADGISDDQLASTLGSIESGPWQVGSSGGMWFELSGQNVPEPSSLLLLLAGCTTLMFHKRRI